MNPYKEKVAGEKEAAIKAEILRILDDKNTQGLRTVAAVRRYRELTGAGMKAAHEYVMDLKSSKEN